MCACVLINTNKIGINNHQNSKECELYIKGMVRCRGLGLNSNTKHMEPHSLCCICLLLPFYVSLLTQSKLVAEVLMYGKQRNYMTTVLEKALNAPLISSKDLTLPVKANLHRLQSHVSATSRLLQHSSPSVRLIWWFAAHSKPQSCDLLVRVTTKPQHGQPRLPLGHCGAAQNTHKNTHQTEKNIMETYAHMHA